MRLITTFFLVALATVSVSADEASESSISVPTERSPVIREPHVRHRAPLQSTRSASRALVINLGPLPVEEEKAEIPLIRQRHPIGVHRSLPAEFTDNLVPELAWTDDTDDGQHAAITFRADGANSLRIAVQATLPPGASVQVFDGDGQPRGSASMQADFNASGNLSLWLPSAEGDTLTVQIVVPSAEDVEVLSFTVTDVAHRYASVEPQSAPVCGGHVNLLCVSSPIVRQVADAVGLIVFEDAGRSYSCTGTLLNTLGTPNTFEPYFLTAKHCVGTASVASTVEALWFWRRTTCSGSGTDPRGRFSFSGTDLLATSSRQDSSLLRFRDQLPGGLAYSGWTNEKVRIGTSVFSVHHPNGFVAQYSEGRVVGTQSVSSDGGTVHGAIRTDWSSGKTETGSSGAGLFDGQQLVGVYIGYLEAACSSRGSIAGPFADFYPRISRWINPASGGTETFTYMLPAVPGAGGDIQGFVRITNATARSGEVKIYAIDDDGYRYGPARLSLDAFQTRHFNSEDLEHGSASKGLFGGVGNGTGMWRLDLKTTLTVGAWAYIRTPDGFVTSMHQVAETIEHDDLDARLNNYVVPFFNPGSNTSIRSLLRVINPHPVGVNVTLLGLDDSGQRRGPVRFTLSANRSMLISSQALERGDAGFSGFLGDGHGKWVLIVSGTRPLYVMSLLSTPSGHLTNLSR